MATGVLHFTLFIWPLMLLPSQGFSKRVTYMLHKPERDRAEQAVCKYINESKQSPNVRENGIPKLYLHPVGATVYGTTILFHGGGGIPSHMDDVAKYMFRRKFNVYVPALAGHAQNPSQWPYIRLRAAFGFKAVRDQIMRDEVIKHMLASLKNAKIPEQPRDLKSESGNYLIDRILNTLEKELNNSKKSKRRFKRVKRAIKALLAEKMTPKVEAQLTKYFECDHYRYEINPLARLREVKSLPGPIFAIGYSLGAVEAMNLAARSNSVEKLILLAPFFRIRSPYQNPSARDFLTLAGSLDIISRRSSKGYIINGSVATASVVAGQLATRDQILNPIQKNAKTFCVVAADDQVADVDLAKHICSTKLKRTGSHMFVYPEAYNIRHQILPNLGNRFGKALLQEMYRFLKYGRVDKKNMLSANGDSILSNETSEQNTTSSSGELKLEDLSTARDEKSWLSCPLLP